MSNEKKFTTHLPCILTPEEYDTKSHDLGALCQEIVEKKAAAAFAAKSAKEKIEEMESKRAALARIVTDREEYREVECVERFDHSGRMVRTVRLDTGETVKTRAMELHEYQEEMDLSMSPATAAFRPKAAKG